MTKREAAIVSTYTGYLIGSFSEMHKYTEEIMDRPVWTHEMGDPKTREEIKAKAKVDFINIDVS